MNFPRAFPMKFPRSFHKIDFDGETQTIGLDRDGNIWLVIRPGNGVIDPSANAYARFAPREALRYAGMITTLAIEGIRAQERRFTLPGHEDFPLRTAWGCQRYQELTEYAGTRQAIAQASREESGTFPCTRCAHPVSLTNDGLWWIPAPGQDSGDCAHVPAVPFHSAYSPGWQGTEITEAGTIHHADAVSAYPVTDCTGANDGTCPVHPGIQDQRY